MSCIIRECHSCGYADGGTLKQLDKQCPVCGEPLDVSFDEAMDHGPEPEDEEGEDGP